MAEQITITGIYKSPYEPDAVEQEVTYVANEILIKYAKGITPVRIENFEIGAGLKKLNEYETGFILYSTPISPLEMVNNFKDDENIEFIEPNLVRGSSLESQVQRTGAVKSALGIAPLVGVALVLGILFLLRK